VTRVGRRARVGDVHELAMGMPFVTVERIGGGNPVYQVGRKSLQLLAEVPDRIVHLREATIAERRVFAELVAATQGQHSNPYRTRNCPVTP
jgi:hypothetical protein